VVSNFAGLPGTFGSTDGVGTQARFNVPNQIGAEPDGSRLYVVSNDALVRQVDVATGAVTTLAGHAGSTGTADGIGSAARFKLPDAAVADGRGSLYVSDSGNHTIRRLELATSAVTTLAGTPQMSGSTDGTGSAARFNNPTGLAVDGNALYVADAGNHAIRRIDLTTSAVTTWAGQPEASAGAIDGVGTAAKFSMPAGLASDGQGHLYVADAGNHVIRRIEISTVEVSTVAGTAGQAGITDGAGALARFDQPNALVVSGSSLFVVEFFNEDVRRIDLSTAQVTRLAGQAAAPGASSGVGSRARFYLPRGITADQSGNLYVSDTFNNAIRKLAGVCSDLSSDADHCGSCSTQCPLQHSCVNGACQ
jgi:sugar lactone lactonase YvrE